MNGIVDIGNSYVKWGLFREETLVRSGRTDYGDWATLKELDKEHTVNWFFSSVQQMPDATETGFSFDIFEPGETLPVTIDYRTPSTLGKDRIAAVCGALSLFPGETCLVIDAGTCITCDLLLADGKYPGGSISPGIRMRLKAMHAFTGRLPDIAWEDIPAFPGDSTKNSMLQGVKQGVLGEIERQIRLYGENYPGLKVLVSGGDADFFEKNLKKDIFAAPYLVLVGLNKILIHKQSLNA